MTASLAKYFISFTIFTPALLHWSIRNSDASSRLKFVICCNFCSLRSDSAERRKQEWRKTVWTNMDYNFLPFVVNFCIFDNNENFPNCCRRGWRSPRWLIFKDFSWKRTFFFLNFGCQELSEWVKIMTETDANLDNPEKMGPDGWTASSWSTYGAWVLLPYSAQKKQTEKPLIKLALNSSAPNFHRRPHSMPSILLLYRLYGLKALGERWSTAWTHRQSTTGQKLGHKQAVMLIFTPTGCFKSQ